MFLSNMVLYYPEKQPSLQRFRQASSDPVGGMIASFILDQTHSTFTNLDVLSGRVVLRLATSTNVNSVVVKLEGESRTRLLPPPTNEESRPRPVREVHKVSVVLYQFSYHLARLLKNIWSVSMKPQDSLIPNADSPDPIQTPDGVSTA